MYGCHAGTEREQSTPIQTRFEPIIFFFGSATWPSKIRKGLNILYGPHAGTVFSIKKKDSAVPDSSRTRAEFSILKKKDPAVPDSSRTRAEFSVLIRKAHLCQIALGLELTFQY